MNPVSVQTPRIDFIFQVPGQFEVLSHAHLESLVDWLYPSDHVPVLVEFAPTP